MMRLLSFLFFVITVYSCTVEEDILVLDDPLLGKWQLIEQLSDPGDGSGTFQRVDSERIVEFLDTGIVSTNGSWCNMGSPVDEPVTASYDTTTQIILVETCGNNTIEIRYELLDNELILAYPCIEPCAQKFEKIE